MFFCAVLPAPESGKCPGPHSSTCTITPWCRVGMQPASATHEIAWALSPRGLPIGLRLGRLLSDCEASLTSGSPTPGRRKPSIWTPYFPPLPPALPLGSQAVGAQRRQGTRAPQNCHRSLLLGVRCQVRRERDKRWSEGSLSPGLPCPTSHHAQPDTKKVLQTTQQGKGREKSGAEAEE